MVPNKDQTREQAFEAVIRSDPSEARRIQDRIEDFLSRLRISERDSFCVKLGMEEALVNAIKHGNQMDRNKTVTVYVKMDDKAFEARVTDQGAGFDPDDVPDPTDIENLERPCGRGLMLIRHYMTEVTYNEKGNSVLVRRVFNLAQSES
jgi:serine/threonine-protein kinase RsbW